MKWYDILSVSAFICGIIFLTGVILGATIQKSADVRGEIYSYEQCLQDKAKAICGTLPAIPDNYEFFKMGAASGFFNNEDFRCQNRLGTIGLYFKQSEKDECHKLAKVRS
jgi:hypothetical protein